MGNCRNVGESMASNLRLVKSGPSKEQTDYEKKIIFHRLGNAARFLLLILGIVVAGLVISSQMRNKVYTTYNRLSSEPLTVSSGAKMLPLKDRLLIYTNDGIKCVDSKGKDVWNQAYEMQSPVIQTCGNIVGVGDYNGRTIYVMDTEGSIGSINTNMPITTFCVAESGVVAAVLEESNLTWIYLYDAHNGKTIAYMKTTMGKSGYPVSISLSPNGSLLQVSYLYTEGGKIKSSVAFYNFGEVGQGSIDKYVSGYDYVDAFVPIVKFLSNSNAFAVADGRLMFYSGSQKPVSAAEVLLDKQIQAVYYSDKYVALVFLNQSGETKYRMDVYECDGTKRVSLDYDLECQNVVLDEDTVLLYARDQCVVYSMDGVQKFEGNYEKMIGLVIPSGTAYKYTIVTQNSIDVIQLK